MQTTVSERVQKHRAGLRAAGLRPVQIWVPYKRRPDFIDECKRQSRLAGQSDLKDAEVMQWLDTALSDMGDLPA